MNVDDIRKAPWDYGFYHTVRWFENQHPEQARVGEAALPKQEPVRFGQMPDLSFAPSTLSALDTRKSGPDTKIISQFSGLFGPQGPLPTHFTEYAFDRVHHHNDETLVAFFDIFHQRFLSLFYRAWANTQPAVQLDRKNVDRFARYVGSLCGFGVEALEDRDKFPDSAKRHFAGLLGHQRKDAESLVTLLTGIFFVPAQVEEFVGEWISIPAHERCGLGLSKSVAALGETATLGERCWSVQHKIRIRLGPLEYSQFNTFLPGEALSDRLIAIVRAYTNEEFDWDLQLILEADEVPEFGLGSGTRLGWNSWLGKDDRAQDADDAVLDLQLDRALCS